MIVDDEPKLVFILSQFAKLGGLETIGFTSSEEAIEAFRREPNAYDVIITDLNMGSLSGVELMTLMRKVRPDVAILLVTGDTLPDDVNLGPRSQILLKPFTGTEFNGAVAALLGEQGSFG